MKFRDYLKQIQPIQYRLYVDMDDVLCDFKKAFNAINGKTTYDEIIKKEKTDKMALWNHIKKGGEIFKFYFNLEWHPEGIKLWEYIKDKKPIILSSLGDKNPDKIGTKIAKQRWLKKHGINCLTIFTEKASDKQAYADEKSILIDDNEQNIREWNERRGIGLQFRTADEVIRRLKELGI